MNFSPNDFQDKIVIGIGTFSCGTMIVEGSNFISKGITFENLQQNKKA